MQKWTESDWKNINEMIASGAASVSYSSPGGGRSVSYRTLPELIALRYKIGLSLGYLQPLTPEKVIVDG